MKQKNESITRACAYCEHAAFSKKEAATPPLLHHLTQSEASEEDTIFCPYKKHITPGSKCHCFRFDPLKYRPKAPPSPITLDKDELLL